MEITLLTDSKSLFDVSGKGTTTLEKRLMIDIRVAREACEDYKISQLRWLRRKFNLSEPMTKLTISEIMREFMRSGLVDFVVEKYVVRTRTCRGSNTSEEQVGRNVGNSNIQLSAQSTMHSMDRINTRSKVFIQ